MAIDKRIPVTVLTGFLGSGKTTLLNRILSENHGRKIAVIENEFGEVGVDQQLVIGVDEEIFEMSNGCICCTVRGDLIRVLGNLAKRKDRFERVLVETTGLADPGPVAQTFFVDEDIKENFALDAVVTVVDAKHHLRHLSDAKEASEQVAFADVILLNKCDLVPGEELDSLEASLRRVNGAARVFRTRMADGPLDKILDVGGFNINRALDVDAGFLNPEYPFEWAGVFEADSRKPSFSLKPGPDRTMDVLLMSLPGRESPVEEVIDRGVRLFSGERVSVSPGGTISADVFSRLSVNEGGEFPWDPKPGLKHVFFTQHAPSEFSAEILGPGGPVEPSWSRAFAPDHEHDGAVTSVGITDRGALDFKKLNVWFSGLLAEKGKDIFRMKGVLNIGGEPRRWVFQGVHMLFNAEPGPAWKDGERENRLIFIGRNLDRTALTEGFRSCLA